MHPDTDTSSDTAEAVPAPASLRRPEHTILSIFFMLLLSTGVLYLVDRALREDVTIVQRWDLGAVPLAQSPWTFPGSEVTQTAGSVSYVVEGTGPGPAIDLTFDTSKVRRIRIAFSVSRAEDGQPVPFAAEWYWSSPDEVAAAAGAWPFSEERGATFEEPDRHDPDLRVLDISRHPRWKGMIAKAFIGIKLPDRKAGPYRINARYVEFLE